MEVVKTENRKQKSEVRGQTSEVRKATSQRTRVAVIVHRVGPYHFARLHAAALVVDTLAIELSGADKTYAWDLVHGADGFKRVTVFDKADSRTKPTVEVVRGVQSALNEHRPEVVAIPGWAEVFSLAALTWCASKGVPAIMMSETTAWDERRVPWKEWMKRRLMGLCSTALAGGRPQAEYLEQLGMPHERIFLGYDAVDNDYFAKAAQETRNQKLETRNKYKLPENYFLASARFIKKKNLSRLIKAYARYYELVRAANARQQAMETKLLGVSAPIVPWSLVLLGDGPLRSSILNLRSSLGMDAYVHLPGFKQYDELPVYYGLASTFVHASTTEQWGLVVNEAMASSLPVLVSNRCGCAADLVKDGINGFTFDPYNVEQLAQLMFQISVFQPVRLSALGDASREIISHWGPERFASGLQQAVECALRTGLAKPTLLQRMILKAMLWK